jgi:hypothetical protein
MFFIRRFSFLFLIKRKFWIYWNPLLIDLFDSL